MTLKEVDNLFFYPVADFDNTAQSISASTIDSANESIGNVVIFNSTYTIRKVSFRTSAISTSTLVDVRIETINAGGTGSGTLYQSSSNVLFAADTGTSFVTATLGSDTIVHKGSSAYICVKMLATSVGNIQMASLNYAPNGSSIENYGLTFLGGSNTKSSSPFIMGIGLDNNDYPYHGFIIPVSGVSSISVTTATTIDEIGVLFSLPFPSIAYGAWGHVDFDVKTDFVLYDSDTTTVLALATQDTTNRQVLVAGMTKVFFNNTVSLLAENTYRLTYVPHPGATLTVTASIVSSNILSKQAFSGYPRVVQTSRVNSGGWTEDTRSMPYIGIILKGFDDGTSVGGSSGETSGVWGL